MVLQVSKYLLILHVPSCYNKLHSLMLFLHELKEVLVLVKQFSFINRNVSQAGTIHIVQHFPIATESFSQCIEIQQISGPFIQICNTRFVQYRYI